MEKCVDHPDNMAVDVCKQCSRYICGLHDSGLCYVHQGVEKSGKITIILFAIFFISILTIFMGFIINTIMTFQQDPSLQPGQTVTTNSNTVTVPSSFGNLTTLIVVFTAVAIPILLTIIFILYRLAKNSNPSFLSQSTSASTSEKQFFCQRCGHMATMDDDSCPKCGKSLNDEKRLIR